MTRRIGVVATLVAVVAMVALAACTAAPPKAQEDPVPKVEETYAEAVDAWHRERVERLRTEDGWLSLVGLHWLEPGANTFGRAARHDVANERLPVLDAGVLTLGDDGVTFVPAPGVDATGVPDDGRLVADTDGTPTVVSIGTCRFHAIRRGDRYGIRVKDTTAPVRASFAGIDRFGVDPAWRVEARFEPAENEAIPVGSIIGTVSDEPIAGRAVFDRAGTSCRMILMPGGAPDRFFVVFGDETNGDTTYGGGRFLVGELADDGAHVVLDFNRAYNPPCAFTPYATCPVPVADNRLPFAVTAGERKWSDGH